MDNDQTDTSTFKTTYQNTPTPSENQSPSNNQSSLAHQPLPVEIATLAEPTIKPSVDSASSTDSNTPDTFRTIATIGAIITFLGIFGIFTGHWSSLGTPGRILVALLAPVLSLGFGFILRKFARIGFSEVFFFLYAILIPISVGVIFAELTTGTEVNGYITASTIFFISAIIGFTSNLFLEKSPLYFLSHLYTGISITAFAALLGRDFFPDPSPVYDSYYNMPTGTTNGLIFTSTALSLFSLFEIFFTEFTKPRLEKAVYELLLTFSVTFFFAPLLYLSTFEIIGLDFQPAVIWRFGITPISLILAYIASLKFHRHIIFITNTIFTLVYAIILAAVDFSSLGFAIVLTFSGITLLALSIFSAYAYKTYFPEHLANLKSRKGRISSFASVIKAVIIFIVAYFIFAILRLLLFLF